MNSAHVMRVGAQNAQQKVKFLCVCCTLRKLIRANQMAYNWELGGKARRILMALWLKCWEMHFVGGMCGVSGTEEQVRWVNIALGAAHKKKMFQDAKCAWADIHAAWKKNEADESNQDGNLTRVKSYKVSVSE